MCSSPLLDGGNDTPPGCLATTDPLGVRRIIGPHVDIGAYEFDRLFAEGCQASIFQPSAEQSAIPVNACNSNHKDVETLCRCPEHPPDPAFRPSTYTKEKGGRVVRPPIVVARRFPTG